MRRVTLVAHDAPKSKRIKSLCWDHISMMAAISISVILNHGEVAELTLSACGGGLEMRLATGCTCMHWNWTETAGQQERAAAADAGRGASPGKSTRISFRDSCRMWAWYQVLLPASTSIMGLSVVQEKAPRLRRSPAWGRACFVCWAAGCLWRHMHCMTSLAQST